MNNTIVTDGIFRLSANVDNLLFESLWPVPNGVAINSYIVKGEKVAIVDGVCGWDGVPETLFAQLDQMGVDVKDINYVILNHLEPDHSGWIEQFMEMTEDFVIVATQKGVDIAKAFYGFNDRYKYHVVKSGDTIDLGDGKTLLFEEIPNVHWPETMATYEVSTKTLMPCDAFGSFGAVAAEKSFDDQLTEKDLAFFEEETFRYYSNIVSSYSVAVKNAIKKLGPVEIDIIAPGHGIVWRKDPGRIVNLYSRMAGFAMGPAQQEITVVWGSMYGMTQKGVDPVIDGIKSEGVPVHVHKVPETHMSYILPSSLRSQVIVLAMPTYEYKMFTPMAHTVDYLGRKRIFNRKAFRFGSYGWSGGAQKELDEILLKYKMNWDFLEPVEFRGSPSGAELELINRRGKELARVVKETASVSE